MALYVRDGFRASWSVLATSILCFVFAVGVFRICGRIINFYAYTFYRNPGHDGLLYDCLLESADSMVRVQSVDDKAVFVFVGDANAHRSD